VVTQFIADVLYKGEIRLVDGGQQKRCFTDIDDGIACLMKIIENKVGNASSRIFNIGNPHNEYSIIALAELIIELVKEYPAYKHLADATKIINVNSADHYGKHYQDINRRVPSIANAKTHLGWEPKVGMREALKKTLDYHLGRDVQEIV
jgi:nucleoside-diphosphate-sugar epimerase